MLRKILKIILIIIVVAFIALQFIRPSFNNPPVVESETLAATTEVPPEVESILARSCNDCHSNRTNYPWYSQISPFSWFLAAHIDDGRREVNFDSWKTYTDDKKIQKLDEVCEQVEQAFMPLPEYLWLHREAVLSEADAKLLCDWAKGESERLSK